MTETKDSNPHGLLLANNGAIRAFLLSTSQNRQLSDELREIASNLYSQDSIPYRSLKSLWGASEPCTRPKLLHLISGSGFIFLSPKPREKSEELKERLQKLTELAERKAYNELVKDITPRKDTIEPFSSYKDQLGFGLHVVLIMFTGYLVGYATFRALFNHSAVMNAAGGVVGLVFGMLLETVLFIIRFSNHDIPSRRSNDATSQKKDL